MTIPWAGAGVTGGEEEEPVRLQRPEVEEGVEEVGGGEEGLRERREAPRPVPEPNHPLRARLPRCRPDTHPLLSPTVHTPTQSHTPQATANLPSSRFLDRRKGH